MIWCLYVNIWNRLLVELFFTILFTEIFSGEVEWPADVNIWNQNTTSTDITLTLLMSQVVMKWFSSLLSGHCYAGWYGMEFVRDSGMNRIEINFSSAKKSISWAEAILLAGMHGWYDDRSITLTLDWNETFDLNLALWSLYISLSRSDWTE